MTNTNLIIAIIFAGSFGLALMFIALWCLSRYIYRCCLNIGQWLHALSPQPPKDPLVVYVENHRSRSRKSERGRNLDPLRTKRDHESGNFEYEQTGDGSVDTRPTVQLCAPVQVQQQPYTPRYYPLLWQDQTQNIQSVMRHQTSMHWQAQGTPQVPTYATQTTIPQQPNPQMTMEISEPFQGPSRYQPHMLSQPQKCLSAKARSPEKYARKARKVDYIHICDEYPPFVLEALNKAAPSSPPTSSSSSSSSSLSDGSGTTQEVPRATIPCATAACIKTKQCPHIVARGRDTSGT